MLDRILPIAVVLLTVFAVVSAVLLVNAAVRRPYIGALVERAAIGVLIAGFGVVSAILVLNTEADHALFDIETARILFRLFLLGLLGVPSFWVWLYRSGRLGGR